MQKEIRELLETIEGVSISPIGEVEICVPTSCRTRIDVRASAKTMWKIRKVIGWEGYRIKGGAWILAEHHKPTPLDSRNPNSTAFKRPASDEKIDPCFKQRKPVEWLAVK